MSYLKFDKNLMINLEQSLPKEMLRTNQAGAYHCTSIVDCNTRKQHGLLVVPLGDGDYNPHVLLSSLDETVIQHGAPFNLGCTATRVAYTIQTATSTYASLTARVCPAPPIASGG